MAAFRKAMEGLNKGVNRGAWLMRVHPAKMASFVWKALPDLEWTAGGVHPETEPALEHELVHDDARVVVQRAFARCVSDVNEFITTLDVREKLEAWHMTTTITARTARSAPDPERVGAEAS